MRIVDWLRIRQVIALIAIVPMLVGFVAVGLLAVNQNRSRDLAVQELHDLQVLVVVRGLESGLAAERAFYEGWTSLTASGASDEAAFLATPVVRDSIKSTVSALGDEAIAAIDGVQFSVEQRRDIDEVVAHWYELRSAFDAEDDVGMDETKRQLDSGMLGLQAMVDGIVAQQGARWLPIDRQSRYGITMAEEMSFVGVLLVSGNTGDVERRRAAVLSDRTASAYSAMIAVSTPSQKARVEAMTRTFRLADLRAQAQGDTSTMSPGETFGSLFKLAEFTAVVDQIRVESANEIRSSAEDKAAAASTNRNLALALAVVVILGPMALLVAVGGRLSRRLGRLADAARRVANGELDVRIGEVTGRDEVAEVSAAFNDVAETIARSHDQISALAEGRTDDPILDDELPGIIGQTLRLALRRLGNATAELAHQANHDRLTGLLDRRGLQAGLDSLDPGEVEGDRGVIMVDLDDFKQINDVHGHAAGDAVLREVASRLVAGTRQGDLIARLGGDEFLVLTSKFDTCEATAQRLAADIAAPIDWSGLVLPVTASIGWTSVGIDESFEDVLHRADKAMYAAKRSGKNRSLSG